MTGRGPELLAPAGDMERLRMALAYGADAVYLSGPDYGMRASAGNFDENALRQAAALCQTYGAALHVTVNTMPRNDDLTGLPGWLETVQDAGADALIIADLGTLRLAERYAPRLQRHISTQANVVNHQSAAAWHELGASRVVLARELSLEEVAEIRARTPAALEIECFVHGAMCVSYAGRCLLSNYMTGRDALRGACAQPCRYRYALMEEQRPGEYFPIGEDAEGSFILNSRDMCMIDHIPALIAAGVDAFKLEGRAKSAYYTAVVTGAYRQAVDAATGGQPLDPVWRGELNKISHRPYSTGFWFGQPGQYTGDPRYIRDWQVCALVEDCATDGLATLSLRNKFAQGDTLELVGPGVRPVSFSAGEMTDMDGLPLTQPRTPQMRFQMTLPQTVPPLSILRKKAGP